MKDYVIISLALLCVFIGYLAVEQREDYLTLRQEHNATVEANQKWSAKCENLIAAQAKLLKERPVVHRYIVKYKELP